MDEDWKAPLRDLKRKLDKVLFEVHHIDYDNTHHHMVREELDVKAVLKTVKSSQETVVIHSTLL